MEFDGGDPSVAVTQFRRAHELQTRLGHATERITTRLNIGLCLVYLDRLDEAAAQLEGATSEAETLDQPEFAARARLALASLRSRQGRPAAAKELLRRVVYEPKDLAPAKRIEAREVLAAILAARDSVQAGLELLEEASDLTAGQELAPGTLRMQSLRGGLLVRMDRPREALDLLLRNEEQARGTGLTGLRVETLARAAQAYRALELPDSSRAILARAAGIWESERDLPLDPEWREQRGAIGARIYTDWAAHLLGAEPGGAPLTGVRIEEAFGRLQRFKGRTLLERMSGPGQLLPEAIPEHAAGFVTLDRLQHGILNEGDLLLDAYLGPEISLLFAITPDEARAVVWPSSRELRPRIGFFHDLHQLPAAGSVTPEEGRALHELGEQLGELLLGDIADLVSASRRLIVVPDGVLNLLPWQSLGPVTGQVVVVPSVTILAQLRSRPPGAAAAPARLGVFADDAPGAAALPGARGEADWLLDGFVGASTPPAPADPDRDLSLWRDFDILHFAAHARSHDASPWQSEIRLGEGDEFAVRAARIAAAELDASLAVLAGCESAGGRILSGEGVQGLTSAFLGAGVPTVLATLWPVDDHATSVLVRSFYRELAAGRTVGAALSLAQEKLRSNPATAHPFFWAGFQVVGDSDLTLVLQPRRSPWRWALIPAVFLGLVVILMIGRRLS
jgi:tetratricopeptide (TPR) repeat protein